jgi:alkylated DNA repair protein alkB family protein 7
MEVLSPRLMRRLVCAATPKYCGSRLFATVAPDASLVDARHAPKDFNPRSAVVYNEFITDKEGDSLVQDIAARMKRRRYEKGHWDAVITDYKEVELFEHDSLGTESQVAIERVRQQLIHDGYVNGDTVQWLPCHAIDLKRDGELKAHVDSIKFSGDVVAGISLLSSCIMRLKPDEGGKDNKAAESGWVDLLLPPLSLYVLSGFSRYQYSHELLPCGSIFEQSCGSQVTVERDHRLSVIFRDAKIE